MAEPPQVWNSETERQKWLGHDTKFSKHFGDYYRAWTALGFKEPEWTQRWAHYVTHTLGWEDVSLRCLPVWRVTWIPDLNSAAVCVEGVVPCGLIHTKITYMPCPDHTFQHNPELFDRWKIAMVGDMTRIKTSIPTAVNPTFRDLAADVTNKVIKQLGLWETYKRVTLNFSQFHRCHPFGHIIPPNPVFLSFANSYKDPPLPDPEKQEQKGETDRFRVPMF